MHQLDLAMAMLESGQCRVLLNRVGAQLGERQKRY